MIHNTTVQFDNIKKVWLGNTHYTNYDLYLDVSVLPKIFPNITHLSFGHNFNQNIDALANSFPNLTHLRFGYNFNQNIDALANSFPNLKKVVFGNKFRGDIGIFHTATYKQILF